MRTLTFMALLCASTAATAQAEAPALYSHAVPLTVSGRNALVSVRLPPAAYLHARSASLADLRIFDAAGKSLPYALIQPWAQARSSRRELPVKIFPAQSTEAGQVAISGVEIKAMPDGAVITSVTPGPTRAPDTGPASLVLDLGQSGAPVDALVFTLPDGMSNYQADLALEVSSDLRTWQEAGSGSVSWLSNSTQDTISSNRISFAPRAFRYARLTWRQGKPLQFARIVAESTASADTAPALDSIALQPGPGHADGDYVYQSAPAIPVRRLSLKFSEENVVLPALLGVYAELPAIKGGTATRWEFRPRMQATFFRLTQDGKLREGGDITLADVHADQWVLRMLAPVSGLPKLHLSWQPATAVFMATGRAPYTLSVGRDKAKAGERDIAQVAPGFSATELQALERAVPGAVVATGKVVDRSSEAAEAAKSARRRVALLWGALLLGVAALGVMVWKLMKQVNKPE